MGMAGGQETAGAPQMRPTAFSMGSTSWARSNASRTVSDGDRDTVVMGTFGYAAPEQLGLSQTDARTDIYATGVLYNVMLTGRHPSVAFARGRAGRIVRKCTAMNPEERYQTAEALLRAL